MKQLVLAAVLTLSMLLPAMAMDVHPHAGTLLAASNKNDKDTRKPPVLIIKGEGGKVTGVEKGDKKKPPRKK